MMSESKYTCSMCGRTFIKEVTDEKAMEETHSYWPDIAIEECDAVCDDSWQHVRPDQRKGVQAYFDFLAAMKKIQSLTSPTGEQIDALKQSILNMGMHTEQQEAQKE